MPIDMKNIIADTYASLAKQKDIDKITVKALIDACHISRQTFYYHFQDIMDVIQWSVKQATQKMLDQGLKASTPEEALSIIISFASDNHKLIQRLLDSRKREYLEELFVQAIRQYLQELVINKSPELSLNYSDLEFFLDFWSFGITGILFKYCDQEQVDAEKLAHQICRLLPGRSFDHR
ncbi:MAG: TetR/AcrR family transcriptional regulator C-terminal domain-containing protein [Ruminococcus sp.]|jgi:AcrR family transcriptional regulator